MNEFLVEPKSQQENIQGTNFDILIMFVET